jgi:hypothetical protein
MLPVPPVIEVSDPKTWPHAVLAAVRPVADRLAGFTGSTGSLPVTLAEEAEVEAALAGANIRLYHATRLLPVEVERVRAEGLRLLDINLIGDRLDTAVQAGALTNADRDLILATNALNDPYTHRPGLLYAVTTTLAFSDDISGVWRLLGFWGGEAVYIAHEDAALGQRLSRIGVPAIVVFTAPAAREDDNCRPGRTHVLVGTLLELEDVDADFVLRQPVPAEAVEDVWMPGHSAYDRFPLLPS